MRNTQEYLNLQKNLAKGWNTWDTRSLLNWVHLPSAISLNFGLKNYCGVRNHLRSVQVGHQEIELGDHAYDGSYSECVLKIPKTTLLIKTAIVDDELYVYVKPECEAKRKSLVVVEIGLLWNQPGTIEHKSEYLYAHNNYKKVSCFSTTKSIDDPHIHSMSPYLAVELNCEIGFSTGQEKSLEEIKSMIETNEKAFKSEKETDENLSTIKKLIQICTAWDTIYEPGNKRVVTPVSRHWNDQLYGGYALFCWDTFFAGVLASVDNEDLAHANVIEILREATEDGFVPNVSSGTGRKSRDRSQPPVGSISILQIYHRYKKRWLLEQSFEPLLKWNQWWIKNRQQQGYLCWGSSPYPPFVGDRREETQQNTRFGAALESGLDNSPMYDDIPFDEKNSHFMLMADVGLMSMYIADCNALIKIAQTIGRIDAIDELNRNKQLVSDALTTLWSEEHGIYLNKRLDTGEFETRLSPTHFYPLLAEHPDENKAQRMIEEHFFNPDEFYGDWGLPSIAKNDPAYQDQDYWRGRIWAPMNWLVYLGLRKYPQLEKARKDLTEKSTKLLLKEWKEFKHIHENYNNNTGAGCDVKNSDPFYHWGCLLGMIYIVENDSNFNTI